MDDLQKASHALADSERCGPGPVLDCLSFMLRHLVRHLTAFDLDRFHNRGANYPDALALDAWLKAFLAIAEQHPTLLVDDATLRRRAYRQGWMMRKLLEGLPVPDQPTSPGENLRVLPEGFPRLPDEQLADPGSRTRRLFENQPAEDLLSRPMRTLLESILKDLDTPHELRELGMATFLDRPLGVLKQPGEVDRTPLVSYEACSLSTARQRLDCFRSWGLISHGNWTKWTGDLERLAVGGLSVMELPGRERPGVVALEDAQAASPDFLILRGTSSVHGLLEGYDWRRLQSRCPWLFTAGQAVPGYPRHRLLVRVHPIGHGLPLRLRFYNDAMQPLLELAPGPLSHDSPTYTEWAGGEFLTGGLQVISYADARGTRIDSREERIIIPPIFRCHAGNNTDALCLF
jgi:hypothetical protein